ncbi:hypothetical protein [Xanthomarina sp. GH4-25]|uniref:hypothetical protein n=1 Tax=Xanthomarina sp. GH4-25 TaxID=3349335 RepID=UPI000D673664|nr:hypothetical protein DI383_00465 [Flavobacteriaceae bacterium LYZ1037]
MKKVMAIAFISLSFLANAQQKKEIANKMQDYTPEEIAQVQTKQMTLDLDLTEAQQKQVLQLNLENAKERKAKYESKKSATEASQKVKPSKEDRLNMKNEQLDRQIEMKKRMKSILNDQQYDKWEKISSERRDSKKTRVHQKKQMKHKE